MLVHQFLEKSAARFPGKNAVWYKEQWMTYQEINSRSNSLAAFLVNRGIRRGDRVAILLENSFDYIISYFGILKAGAVVVALNTDTVLSTVHHLLNDCQAIAIMHSKKYAKMVNNSLLLGTFIHLVINSESTQYENIDNIEITDLQAIYADNVPFAGVRIISVDLAAIVYTSGSTGKPKGVMLTHQNIHDNTVSIATYLEMTDIDRMMVVLPFYYIYGNSLLTTHFYAGGSLVIDNGFMYPDTVLATMQNLSVTGFAGVPSTFMILLQHSAIRNVKFETLRYVTQAGGHMAVPVQEDVVKTFAPAKLYVMYGATELSPRLTWLPPDRWNDKKGSIGIPIPNVDAFIADEHGNHLPPGTEGEIVARGSNVMSGYWNDPQGTANVLRNGLYYTGDIGREDEEGFLYVTGRSSDLLKIGGNRVSTREIEDALLQIEGIIEAAVIGLSDPVLGDAAKAFIVSQSYNSNTISELRTALSNYLPIYKMPKLFEFCSSLPKNEAGKVLKKELRSKEGSGRQWTVDSGQ
ncbi:MAG TPA: class I adenylate-forming enzyme family protein [Chitinispirillaceae bacterium]|nr:class I adenylate-forming enzyme family protein [Chitinispirillaceae bacterium]